MKFKLNVLLILLSIISVQAQVGIQTQNPKTALDVNGDMNVAGKIYTGGTDSSLGNPGDKNKALTSNGDNEAVSWEEVKIPVGYEGGLYLTSVEALSDRAGLNLTATGFGTYNENASLSGNWIQIPALTRTVSVTHPVNKIHVQLQTTAQINFNGSGSFACGIFMDNQLKGVRVDVVSGPIGSYNVFNINTSFDNVPTGNHTFKIACRGRTFSNNSTTARLAIGRANVPANLGADMAQSSLNLFVLEEL